MKALLIVGFLVSASTAAYITLLAADFLMRVGKFLINLL